MNKLPHDWEKAVDRFADAMKSKLAVHVAKGDWRNVECHRLWNKLQEEVRELENNLVPPINSVEVLLEAADVALCAMMIADIKMGSPRPAELAMLQDEKRANEEGR